MPDSGDQGLPVPAEAREALSAARAILDERLVAAYLHGSAVSGGLRPDSDVDILLVADRPMTATMRQGLLARLMRISGRPHTADGRRPLEVVVFGTAGLAAMPYPPRAEFHYGEWLRAGFAAGARPQAEANPDFVIVVAQARQAAVTLAGPPPRDLLPEISDRDLRRAIGDARKDLIAGLHGDERNVLLTLARMWCTLATGRIVAKDAAAEWVLPRLDGASAALLDRARRGYLGLVADDWSGLALSAEALAKHLGDHVAALV